MSRRRSRLIPAPPPRRLHGGFRRGLVTIAICMVTTQQPSLVGGHQPVRQHGHRLVDQLETAFRLADGLDGGRSRIRSGREVFSPTSIPSHSSLRLSPCTLLRFNRLPRWPSPFPLGRRKSSGHRSPPGYAGKIQLDGKVQGAIGRQVFQLVGDVQRRGRRAASSPPW